LLHIKKVIFIHVKSCVAARFNSSNKSERCIYASLKMQNGQMWVNGGEKHPTLLGHINYNRKKYSSMHKDIYREMFNPTITNTYPQCTQNHNMLLTQLIHNHNFSLLLSQLIYKSINNKQLAGSIHK
jgi:hypothetical protein